VEDITSDRGSSVASSLLDDAGDDAGDGAGDDTCDDALDHACDANDGESDHKADDNDNVEIGRSENNDKDNKKNKNDIRVDDSLFGVCKDDDFVAEDSYDVNNVAQIVKKSDEDCKNYAKVEIINSIDFANEEGDRKDSTNQRGDGEDSANEMADNKEYDAADKDCKYKVAKHDLVRAAVKKLETSEIGVQVDDIPRHEK
jgi:hypothetical protein